MKLFKEFSPLADFSDELSLDADQLTPDDRRKFFLRFSSRGELPEQPLFGRGPENAFADLFNALICKVGQFCDQMTTLSSEKLLAHLQIFGAG